MNEFVRLAASERRLYCEQAAARLGLPAPSVEKDFWVCRSLRLLFGLPVWTGHLTFKGGTSLSKGWRLIERFSEDIDVVIDRDILGFAGPDDPQQAPSVKQRQKRLEALKAACQDKIHSELLPALREALFSNLPEDAVVSVEPAPPEEDPDQQTILFAYPSVLATPSAYLRRLVKIELGARSDTEHRQVFFRYGWMDYMTCRPGAFRLVPPDSHLAGWKRDYDAMQGEMFFGQVPSFEEILRVVSEFEQRFNTAGGPCCGSVQLNA